MVWVGDRTGLIRAQDRVVVQSAGDAKRLAAGRSPYTPPPEETPRGREVYAPSFRLEPPAEIRPEEPNMPPGPSVLATVGRLVGYRDLRLWGLLALALLALRAARRGETLHRPTAVGVALLLAPLGLGTVLGSAAGLPLVALVAAWSLSREAPPWAAGLLAGLAVALDHRAALLVPLVLMALAGRRDAARPALLAGGLAYGLVVLPVALLDPPAFVGRLFTLPSPGAGMGLFNVFGYFGAEGSMGARALAALAPLAALLVTVVLLRRRETHPLALAGLAGLAWIVLAPRLSPDAVGVPVVLLGWATVLSRGEVDGDGRPGRATGGGPGG
jgi:hypothetical protein